MIFSRFTQKLKEKASGLLGGAKGMLAPPPPKLLGGLAPPAPPPPPLFLRLCSVITLQKGLKGLRTHTKIDKNPISVFLGLNYYFYFRSATGLMSRIGYSGCCKNH